MEAKPSWMTAGETQLDEFAALARELIVRIDRLPHHTAAALDLAGWHCGHAFALRAELGRVVECADRARLGPPVRAIAPDQVD
jgi:hypothetical protein